MYKTLNLVCNILHIIIRPIYNSSFHF